MYPKWRGLCGILTLAASLAIMGCGSSSNSNVRAVNASPGFAPFTFQVGQTGFASSLPYGTEGVQPAGQYATVDTSGKYRQVSAGANQNVITFAAPGSTPLASEKVSLLTNGSYTIVSIGASPSMALATLTDNGAAPPSGQAGVRFMNTANSTGPVDVYVTAVGAAPGGSTLAHNIGFNQPTTYLPQATGTLEIQITRTGSSQALVTAPFSPAGGQNYSVFFLDPAPGTGYKLLIINDPISTTAAKK